MLTVEQQDEFDNKHSDILQRLADSLIEATPEWWTSATLELDYQNPQPNEGPAHTIINAAFPKDLVTPTDDMFDITFELLDLFRQYHQRAWKKVIFHVYQEEDEDWRYEIRYAY